MQQEAGRSPADVSLPTGEVVCSKMMRAIRPPESKQATTLLVAVRCRPLTPKEQTRSRDILRVVDDKVVVVLDPDVHKDYLDRVQNRSKEKKYVFDIAFGPDASNQDVYKHTVGNMVEGVVRGLNATIFAYGATGSGKTHTMAGTAEDPGLMVQSLQAIFALISKKDNEHEFEVTCSYLEVYNEVIYDLLEKSSGHLELREDPDQGITVAGLKRIQVSSAEKILELLNQGNSRRKTESTDANATSSRSHAVLEIIVKRKQKNQYRSQVLKGKLALVDLAGSERASETNNAGQKLRDGANINRSLLALATCINALGKQQKKGLAYVPYRNSKLTRLLKDGLSGNSRTVMVANVSSGDDQYHHTTNTLKYADRAKEIKTHIQTNIGTVDAHVADYQRMIDNLQVEVSQLRRELAEKDTQLSARTPDKSADDELSWLDVLSNDINENVEERINLQKAVFELEDMNARNKAELQLLDEQIVGKENIDKEEIESLVERRQVILDNIRDNDEAGAHYRQDIEANEAQRKQLQKKIDEAIESDRNKTFLRILSQYRLLGMTNMELQFQMAIRDQIIHDQREALNNLWLVLESSGLDHHQILEIAAQEGIVIEDGLMAQSMSSSMAPTIATTIAPSISRGHVPASPVPILHNQSLTAAGARYTNLMQIQLNSDSVVTSEYRSKSDCHSVDEKDAASSFKSSVDDWKNLSMQEDKVLSQVVDSNLQGTSYSEQDRPVAEDVVKSDGYENNGIHLVDKCKGANVTRLTGFFESKLSPTAPDQPSSLPSSRGRSPPESAGIKVSPATKQRRRPRSGENRQQQRWSLEIGDGSTTGVDAGSEGSETDDSDNGWNDPNKRHTDTLSESFQGGADNELLRRELARLESELQELKKGLDRTSGVQSYPSSANKHGAAASESELQDLRRTISRNCSELQDLKRAINKNANSASYGGSKSCTVPNGSPASTNSSNTGTNANGLSNGHGYPAYSAYSTPGVDTRPWGRLGTCDTPSVVEVAGHRGSSLVPAEVLDNQGYSASAVHRLGKGLTLRPNDFVHPRRGLAEVGASSPSTSPRLSPHQRPLYEKAALRERQRPQVSRKILCT